MKQLAISLLATVVFVSMSTRETIHAQETSPSFKIGGGLGIPLDAEGADNGPAILAGAALPVYGNLHAILEGRYSQFGVGSDPLIPRVTGDITLTGANLGIMLRSPSSPVSVYGQGGIGLTRSEGKASASLPGDTASLSVSVSKTETVFSFTVGGGVHFPINPSIGVAIDARYNHAMTEGEGTKWIPITVSIVFSP